MDWLTERALAFLIFAATFLVCGVIALVFHHWFPRPEPDWDRMTEDEKAAEKSRNVF